MLRKNTASQFIHFQGVDATTGGIKSGVTWTMRRCIDGTFAAGGGTVTEDSTNGWYKCALTQADTNGNNIAYNFTGTGAVPQTINVITTACDPTTATNFGITSLPTTAVTTNASLLTSGTGTDQLHVASGHVSNVDVLTTYTGNTPQTGDGYARLGAPAGASTAADIAAIKSDTGTILTDVNTGAGAIYTRLGAPAGASIAADIAAVKTDTALHPGIRKNAALAAFPILMTDSTNHNPLTGATVTVTRSIDGGAFGAGTLSAVTEISNGWYKFDFGAGDLNGTTIGIRATATGADDLDFTIKTDP